MPTDKINYEDVLKEGTDKLNKSIDNANQAEIKSDQANATSNMALNTASTAETKADSVQEQFNQVVIEGDSSVEAAQARVKEDGTSFDTLKDRLDSSDLQLMEDLIDLEQRGINVEKFGAIGDGVTDDTQAFRDTALYANTLGIPVFIPNKNFYVREGIEIKGGLICLGKIITPNTGSKEVFKFSRNFNVETVSGEMFDPYELVANSNKISGLAGMKGYTIRLSSEEILVKRNLITLEGESDQAYFKNDTFTVIDDAGGIQPSLECDYTDLTKLSVILIKPEKPTTIDGLNIETMGNGENNRSSLVYINRSNVDVYGLTINGHSTVESEKIKVGVLTTACTNINFYNVRIKGLKLNTYGYGISFENTSLVSLNNCHIQDCRHSLSGRHTNTVNINGGYYGQIDNHWGRNFNIYGANLHINIVSEFIVYAGSNISVNNCSFSGSGVAVVAIRDDVSELYGSVVINDNEINTTGPYMRLLTHRNISVDNTFDYERVIKNPEYVSIKGNRFTLPYANPISLVEVGRRRKYSQKTWGKISLENNKAINGNPISAFYGAKNDVCYSGDETLITIKNMEFNPLGAKDNMTSNTIPIRITDETENGSITDDHQFTIEIKDCENVATYLDGNVASAIRIYDSSIVSLGRKGKTYYTGQYWLYHCRYLGTYFGTSHPYNFIGGHFDSNITSDPEPSLFEYLSSQTFTSSNVLAVKGINNHPPLNKVDDTIYETM